MIYYSQSFVLEDHMVAPFYNGRVDSLVNFHFPKAKDRRLTARLLFGDWFETHKMKLGRDYLLSFNLAEALGKTGTTSPRSVVLDILDAEKALLFKLTFGGQ